MKNYVTLEKKPFIELIIRLVNGQFEEETGELYFNDKEKESIKEIMLDSVALEEGEETECTITAVFVYRYTVDDKDTYKLNGVCVKELIKK